MSIKPGRYTITNDQHWNLAFLSDNSDGSSLQACLQEDVAGQEWNVNEHGKGRYSILNFGHKMWASAGTRPERGEHVVGRERLLVWIIKEHDSRGKYTIATADDKLRWRLDSSWSETPITLHDAPPSDPRCHWIFQRVGLVKNVPYDAANGRTLQAEVAQANAVASENVVRREEAEVQVSRMATEVDQAKQGEINATAEVVRILAELHVARQDVAAAQAEATSHVTRREAAEANASRKATEVEEAKQETAQAKAVATEEAAKWEAEVTEAKREEAQAKGEVFKALEELEAATRDITQAKALAAEDATRRQEAEAEASRMAVELEAVKEQAATAKAEVEKKAKEVEAAKEIAEGARREVADEKTKRKAAEAEVARKIEEVEKAKQEAAEIKQEVAMKTRQVEVARQAAEEAVQKMLESQYDPLAGIANEKPCEELDAIFDGAFKSFQAMEHWCGASTDHPQLQQVIQKIQGHRIVYFEAINTSIKTAQNGYGFGNDTMELCSYLLDPETGPGDLQEYIEDMKSKGKQAYEVSKMTLNKFRDVRRGLNEITNFIPREALATPQGANGLYVGLLSRANSERRDTSIRAAMKELGLAALNMAVLSDNINKFAEWWSNMEMVLASQQRSSHGLRPGKDKLRLQQIRGTGRVIRDDYMKYKVKIIKLQGHHH